MFYKTDHHWTTRGAFCVFEKLKNPLKLEADETEYEFYNVSNRFRGTLGSKVASVNSLDSVEICLPKDSAGSYFIDFYNQKEKRASFFFEEKLKIKRKTIKTNMRYFSAETMKSFQCQQLLRGTESFL